ncbi:SanA/YdcF family protein [Rhizomonospora bruguierae]|uniref:SanA/YdcF family protein n=1 Tax=Rhizomonospora bruguierae TaxID=1581705 RepID=UPI0020C0C12E|nr:ElyC/SanA/YdcF family protein [Micromonospora sp. NBRC 107566]
MKSRRRRWLRRTVLVVVVLSLLGGATVAGSVGWMRAGAAHRLYDVDSVPEAPVVLVLGAQVYVDGTPSPFLAARLELARRLFTAGKARAILVSGDHGRWEYDEPGAMRLWLVQHGVPGTSIVADHAGFDTYDSCQRAVRVFGVHRAIVVTQSFHVARAVTLCRGAGLDAYGVGDDSVRVYRMPWVRGSVREYGAAVKAAVDLVSERDPVHLGRPEPGIERALAN